MELGAKDRETRVQVIHQKLSKILGKDDVEFWWGAPNPLLGDLSPDEVSRTEGGLLKIERIVNMSKTYAR